MKVERLAKPAMFKPAYFLQTSFLVSLRCKYGIWYSLTKSFCESTVSIDTAITTEPVNLILDMMKLHSLTSQKPFLMDMQKGDF